MRNNYGSTELLSSCEGFPNKCDVLVVLNDLIVVCV